MTGDTLAQLITTGAVMLSAIATLKGQRTIRASVSDVHDEVRTVNGLTLGNLADRDEGRRVRRDTSPGGRTASERHYVENLTESESDESDEP